MARKPKMPREQFACLKELAAAYHSDPEFCCMGFAPIMEATKMSRRVVRRCVRALARKGLAEYHRSTWDDDGNPRGAGYCCTRAGAEKFEALDVLEAA